ncbi:MAG: fibronectin type III domain-containing protein, partial [Eubacterium sp.]|nr:fibronectin type III domain-containing protein [Eubacterium sp.]
DSINVRWNSNKKQVSGYQVQYSNNIDMNKPKTIKLSKKQAKATITGLKSRKKYYISVRSYKIVKGKKYYSEWSDPKCIKTKKNPSDVDYSTAAELEAALNKGVNCEGKTARIKIKEFHPDSLLGYNLWAGKHLNLVSSSHPNVEVGETIKIRITSVQNLLGSWVINYEKL